jgi:TPP-dependent pyruvate/acetoin dehydrogenase alpha subunit
MRLIREFEDRAAALFAAGKVPGFVHLYAGEEAIAAGVCAVLTDADFITSTHRGHGHCIAKEVDVAAMMAELYGKVTACFFGDGAAEQGTMHESMNLASIWKLPVVFVCENNGFAQTTPSHYHCSAEDIADRATAYSMPGFAVDGTDVFAVYEAATEAVARARRGEGPTLIECKAFRYYGHFEGDNLSYYTDEDRASQQARDPIDKFKKRVSDRGLLTEQELAEVDAWAKESLDAAVKFAEESPYPAPEEMYTDVYVSYA